MASVVILTSATRRSFDLFSWFSWLPWTENVSLSIFKTYTSDYMHSIIFMIIKTSNQT